MSQTITVTTGARLHFGPLSYRPEVGRHFGGVGVMIDEPGFWLSLRDSGQDSTSGEASAAERVRRFVGRYRESCPRELQPPPCAIEVQQAMPMHNGLGSGTQLGLAVARGLALLAEEEAVPVAELARRVGRGRRSAVGIYGFGQGGLIVDAGQSTAEQIGALACRLAMPDDWEVLLITPTKGSAGLSGAGEDRAFSRLGSMPRPLTDRLCRIVLTELLPAIQAREFEQFSGALFEYGRLVGEFFAPVQGGTFGDPQTDVVIAKLGSLGIQGSGQTSWGPTVFAFVPSAECGQRVSAELARMIPIDVRCSRLRNCGATIETSGPVSRR